jgi:peptidoglycan/LPS O-acetylase OafA/YrhL
LGWYGSAQDPGAGFPALVIAALQQVFLLQTAFARPDVYVNVPSWSIAVEFWTYILFGLVTVTLWKRALPAKIAIVIISAIIFDHYLYLDYKLGWVTFFRCFYGFFAGQILYDIYALPVSLKWQSTWGRAAATMAEAAVVVAVFLFMSAPGQGHLQMFAPILFAGVIYIFAPEAGWGSRLLATRPFDALGRYSYSVYMIHYLLIVAILNCLRVVEKLIHIHLIQPQRMYGTDSMGYFIHFGPGWLMVCLAVLILALVVFVSRWTYRLIEQPGQRFFAKLAVKSSNLRPSAPIVTG